jgi:hypothetical protein
MSDKSTIHMVDAYMEEASSPLFLSGYFKSPPRNFHTTEKVELDVMRDNEDVAIVVQDLTAGARENEATLYQNKGFTPPIFDEVGTITAYDQIKRQPGVNPFSDPNYGATALGQAFGIFRKLEAKIRRAIELMASQVFQTGILTLADSAGVTLYTLDFGMRAAHKITTTAWAVDGSTGAPVADITAAAALVRRNGKKVPRRLVFGSGAWARFLANATVKTMLDTHTLRLGQLNQVAVVDNSESGATMVGEMVVGSYKYELWLYDGYYKHPQTGVLTPFVPDNKVLLLSDGRLDLTFGAIPMMVQPESRALPFLPGRMSSTSRGLDLTTNAWFTPDNKHLKVSAGTRPLTIPTAIDTYACLTVF